MKFLGEGDIMKTPYKTLVGEIAKRGIKKKVAAYVSEYSRILLANYHNELSSKLKARGIKI